MPTERGGIGVAWIALLMVSPALAGCLGTAQATAMEAQDSAQEEADRWSQSPHMIEAVGVEGTFSAAMGTWEGDANGDASYWSSASEDPTIGDGHSEIWLYRFVAEERPGTVLTVVVDKDGEVVHTEEEPRDADDDPIGEWNVDSDEAADIAMDANQGLREGTSKEHFGLVFHLGDDEHANPTWTVAGGGGDRSGGGGGVVVIDAVTGEVLASQGGFGSSSDGWPGGD